MPVATSDTFLAGAGSARLLFGISVLWVPLAFLYDGVTVLMLPIRVEGTATELGLISLVGLGIAALLQPLMGWLSDRSRRRGRRFFTFAAGVPAVVGLWVMAGTTGLTAAVVGYVVLQIGATALQAVQQTLIPELVRTPARGRASGLKTAFDVGGSFLAFAMLGMLLASAALVAGAALITGLLLGALVVVLASVPPTRVPTTPIRFSWSMPPGLARLVAARFLFLFATYAVGRFLVLLVAERLGIAPDRAVVEAGWLLALFTLATAAAALPIGWLADRRNPRDVMVAGALIAAIGILVLTPATGLIGVLVGGLVMAVGTAAFITANWAATTILVPASEAGRLMAIANLGTGLAAAAAGVLGPVIDALGFSGALLVAAAVSAAAILPFLDTASWRHPAREITA